MYTIICVDKTIKTKLNNKSHTTLIIASFPFLFHQRIGASPVRVPKQLHSYQNIKAAICVDSFVTEGKGDVEGSLYDVCVCVCVRSELIVNLSKLFNSSGQIIIICRLCIKLASGLNFTNIKLFKTSEIYLINDK